MQNAIQTDSSLEECTYLFISENYHKLPTGAKRATKDKDWNETF